MLSKSNIVHFRNPHVTRSSFAVKVNEENIAYATHYKYLGLVLSEHLDYALTPKVFAQSANRTLGLLIAKTKAFSGLRYYAFTKLYKSIVYPVISYGAALWATQSYNCMNAVQNRAARYFLNVGRYKPNAAVTEDIGWTPVVTKCWKTILTFWCRPVNMAGNRLNKKIFCWSNSKSGNRCKNWNFRVCKLLLELDSGEYYNLNRDISKRAILDKVLPLITQRFIELG